MRALWATWRRQSRRHPSVLVLTLAGLLGFLLGPSFAAAQMPLVGVLVAGLAVAPLALAIYICALTAAPWPDTGSDGGGGQRKPDPPQQPGGGTDWETFERDFRAYVDQHVPVG